MHEPPAGGCAGAVEIGTGAGTVPPPVLPVPPPLVVQFAKKKVLSASDLYVVPCIHPQATFVGRDPPNLSPVPGQVATVPPPAVQVLEEELQINPVLQSESTLQELEDLTTQAPLPQKQV